MAYQPPITDFNEGNIEGLTFNNLLTGMTERGVQAANSLNTRAVLNGKQYLRIPESAIGQYQSFGLNAIEDPNNPGSYLIDEEAYNGNPAVMAAANSNGMFGGALNNLLTYAPLVGGAVLGGQAAGLFGPGAEAAGAGGSLLNAADTALIDAASAGVGGNTGAIAGGAATGAGGPGIWNGAMTAAGGGQASLGGLGALGGAAGGSLPGAVAPAGATGLGGLAATGGSALSNIVSGNSSMDDWLKVGGAIAPGVLGYLGAGKTSDTLQNIYNQQRGDRAGALAKYNEALNNPDTWYNSAPAMGSVDAILRKLSTQGNPAANPGLLSQAAAYNLGGYNNYLSGLAGPAFGGQAAQAQLGTNIAQSQGGQYDAIGLGLGRLLNPTPSPEETIAKYALSIGGMRA